MNGYLIYHPSRTKSVFDSIVVYHDSIVGNQDPYIWNCKFLHSYCHITQMSSIVNNINFWVSGDTFPKFNNLYCDLVFIIKEKTYWKNANTIDRTDATIDTDEAYLDHYRWAWQHPFKRRRRFTLKADPDNSFQPQNAFQELIDILPFLLEQGLTLPEIRRGMRAGFNSKPFSLNASLAANLYSWLDRTAAIKLEGAKIQKIRENNPHLASL